MTYLVNQGKMLNDKKTKENNIEAEATIDISLRLLCGMEKDGLMDTTETEEVREKKAGRFVRWYIDTTKRRCGVLEDGAQVGKLLKENGWKRWTPFYKQSRIQSEPCFVEWTQPSRKWKKKARKGTIKSMKESRTWKRSSLWEMRQMKIKVDESSKIHEDQNHGRAVATGFHGDTSGTKNWTTVEENFHRDRNVDRKCKDRVSSKTYHTCRYLFQEQRWEEQMCQISEYVEERVEREEEKDNSINGCWRKISTKETGVCQMLHSHETWHSS